MEEKKEIKVGNLLLGGNNRIYIQSMTNTKTKDIVKTVEQINKLAKYGCDIIRVAVLDMLDAIAIKEIKKQVSIPLVCDIHFDYKLAIECIKNGCDKIRLNPGNIGSLENVRLIINACKEKNIPIRIGVNSGSIDKSITEEFPSYIDLVNSAKKHVKFFEEENFFNIIVSLKCSDVIDTINAYELASKEFKGRILI